MTDKQLKLITELFLNEIDREGRDLSFEYASDIRCEIEDRFWMAFQLELTEEELKQAYAHINRAYYA